MNGVKVVTHIYIPMNGVGFIFYLFLSIINIKTTKEASIYKILPL